MEDTKMVGVVAVLLIIVWIATGGLSKGISLTPPPAPRVDIFGSGGTGSSDTTGTGDREVERVRAELNDVERALQKMENETPVSPLAGIVSLENGSSWSSDPQNEYVTIRVRPDTTVTNIPISGWRLESPVTGKSRVIGNAVYLPRNGAVNSEQPVFLTPGDRATIVTGRSPKGISFRLNRCTGYFEQTQDFSPSLSTECPRVEDSPQPAPPNALSDLCLDYIERIPSCRAPESVPLEIARDPFCNEFIAAHANYNACIDEYKNAPGFYSNQWRIYLDSGEELWKSKREVITLLDENGAVVDLVTY